MTGQTMVDAPALDPTQARHEAQYRMRKLREHLAALDRLKADMDAQMDEIEVWFNQEAGKHQREVERLKLEMRPYIVAITEADPLKRKSVELVAGRAGFREGRERVVVEDEATALSWLDSAEDGTASCIREERHVHIPNVKLYYPDPTRIPGIKVERGERSFFVERTGKPT